MYVCTAGRENKALSLIISIEIKYVAATRDCGGQFILKFLGDDWKVQEV
jgi:hypothetical protein